MPAIERHTAVPDPATSTVICLDVDGTLVNDRGRIHPHDIDILSHNNSVTFALATGRPLPSLRHTFQRNDLYTDRPIPLPLVLQNGAALYRPGERLHASYPFSRSTQAALISAMKGHRHVAYLLFSLSEVHALWPTPMARDIIQRYDLDARPFQEASRGMPFTKAICVAESAERLRYFAATIAEFDLETSYSIPTVFEITRPGVDKGSGLTTLLAALSPSIPRIVAVGDGGNDLPLFKAADLALAPSTSPAQIRSQADGVVDPEACGLLPPVLALAGVEPGVVRC